MLCSKRFFFISCPTQSGIVLVFVFVFVVFVFAVLFSHRVSPRLLLHLVLLNPMEHQAVLLLLLRHLK
jgi:hypothetical protein